MSSNPFAPANRCRLCKPFRSAKNLPVRKLTTSKRGSPWTPDMARTEAKRLLGLIACGEDPAEHPTPGRGLRDR